ncbi:hypothetical protein IWW47_001170 [Coemansia sp. RSA 2052]|nr:hypothetical protein IWW47_001170 [Coemansia sp. RSA 2052]
MPHINDLPVAILWQILYWAAAIPAKRLSEWKKKLPLVAVCRAWTKLAQPLVFYHVYVEYIKTSAKCDSSANAPSDNTCTVWKSNAELLIARQRTLVARRLTLRMVEFATPDDLRHIALDVLQLDRVDWMYINTLNFSDYCSRLMVYNEEIVVSESDNAEVARTMQYFGQNVRNIAELNFTEPYLGDMGYLVGDAFASMYGGQLQILRAGGSVPLPISYLSRHIAVLELTLDSSAARALPSICGETLRVLKLSKVPHNFAWHHFRYDVFVRPIVFPRLTILGIYYKFVDNEPTKDEVQSKVASGALNCDQLCFPVLKSLTIHNCTPDSDLLYADTPFPELEKVNLSGPFNELRHCSRLRLSWVRDLSINIFPVRADDMTAFYSVTNHFFSSICIGRTATLVHHRYWDSIDPELIRWVNLTKLEMYTVSFEAFCKLVSRLPNLSYFRTTILEFGSTLVGDFSVVEPLFLSTDPLMAWGAKLATLTIQEVSGSFPIAANAHSILALALHAGALKEFTVPEHIMPSVVAFIDEYKDRYPHLDGIELLIDY